jgi:ABC-type uncharacterized transport system permease subunit
MVIGGALGGWAWAMIPAILKVKFGTNEILVSLMLVYVAEQLLASMSLGLLKNPEGFGFPGSRNLQQYESCPQRRDYCRLRYALGHGCGLHRGDLSPMSCFEPAHARDSRSNVTGRGPRAPHGFRGVSPSRLILFCLGASGACLPDWRACSKCPAHPVLSALISTSGYGFTAIIVAFLGRLHPSRESCWPDC